MKGRRLSAPQQSALLNLRFPSFRAVRRSEPFEWRGSLQPTDISPSYRISISLPSGKRPHVIVIWPKLLLREDAQIIPHTFADGSLCLHLPEEWTPDMVVAETIVPWTSLWLYHYEVWYATGTWLGGGHSPDGGKE